MTNNYADWNQSMIDLFRKNGGRNVGQFGDHMLLLTTTGARSGETRVNPLAYTRDGERLVVIASKGGAPTNPAWYHNLVANPVVTVEVGDEKFKARAMPAEGAERERLFEAQAAMMPGFKEYQQKTARRLPVIVLERVDQE